MKESEFKNIVNDVIDEELEIFRKDIVEYAGLCENNHDSVLNLLLHAHLRTLESAGISVAKILKKSGLIQFDD